MTFTALNMSFSSINCNSLNMSSNSKSLQTNKIYGVAKLKTDIIFMSDLRLSNKNMVSNFNTIENIFRTNPYSSYKFFHNSTKNKRGVGILVKSDLNFTELARRADPDENYLLVMADIKGTSLIIGSIYGPNDHCKPFFDRLKADIVELGNVPVVLGGDWNCTKSINNVESNPDCLNMVNPPNIRHSNYLAGLCEELHLTDPFRGLHPFKKDFSYVPRAIGRNNRSRIDFFLISEILFPGVSYCNINQTLQSRLFDHKAINLSFYPVQQCKNNRTSISTAILYDDDIEIVVRTAVLECYIHHINRELCHNFNVEASLNRIGRIWSLLREAGSVYSVNRDADGGEERFILRQACLDEIRIISNGFSVERIQSLPLQCEDDIFLETLLSALKNEVSSYQNFIFKNKTEYKNNLSDELKLCSSNLPLDFALYSSIEKKLNEIVNKELEIEVSKSPIFEHLHNEKASPLFLKLGKSAKQSSKISDICNSDGSPFVTDADRDNYIVNYYKKIYTVPQNFAKPGRNCIREFLGEQVFNNPIVTGSVINDRDKVRLETNITIEELDLAIEEVKTRTAGGPDGIGNAFLKKFWQFLRVPIFKYATKCFTTGKLSNMLAGGAIRLIPKKGDTTKIQNWRPISLLNCTYKVISRAVNNRLKTVADTILSRAQKGFTNSRHIQEVLINVIECIAHCNSANIPGSVVSVDMAKAFDSLNHDFMSLVWEFFGFGQNFIRMLDTLLKGRTSCIIKDDFSFSENFNIETGTLQGDSPSPLLYNFNQQILLFKLDLDPVISSVFIANLVPRPLPILPAVDQFSLESNGETDKTNGFADDTSVCMETKLENFIALKAILTDFGNISGLKCNLEKSYIMAVGDKSVVTDEMREVGFPFVNEINLLGATIDNNLLFLNTVHNKTIEKITNIITFWSRFNLSLPGRINIAKTLCLSQINYLGCIITPTEQQTANLDCALGKFISGKLNISKERLHLPVSEGGLDFPKISNFLTAQQTIWVKRANISTRDTWRYNLSYLCNKNCLTLSPSKIDKNFHPILYFLAESFLKFSTEFYSINDNYKSAYILNNPLIPRSRNDSGLLDNFFFSQRPELDLSVISRLKFSDIYSAVGMKTLWDMNLEFNLNINLLTYMRLGAACTSYNQSLPRNRKTTGASVNVGAFLNGFKKGSKQVRKVLNFKEIEKKPLASRGHIKTYIRLVGEPMPDPQQFKNIFADWGASYLPNIIREFILKFCSNTLGLNVRLSHFVDGASRSCTFCNAALPRIITDETFLHLFFSCGTTSSLLSKFMREFFPELNRISISEQKKFWFFHTLPENYSPLNIFHRTALWLYKYLIWDAKLKKKIPSYTTIKIDFFQQLSGAVLNSSKIKICCNNDSYSISRNWQRLCRAQC